MKTLPRIALFATLFLPTLALADETAQPEIGNLFQDALKAIADKNWFLLSSAGLTIAVLLLRKYVFKSPTGFFATKWGGYTMNAGFALLGSLGISLAGYGGQAFTLTNLGAAGLAALKSAGFASAIYLILQDVFGMSSKPADAAAAITSPGDKS